MKKKFILCERGINNSKLNNNTERNESATRVAQVGPRRVRGTGCGPEGGGEISSHTNRSR